MQENDLPIQPHDCSSKSPAPLRKVKKRTRDGVSKPDKFSFILYSMYSVMDPSRTFLTTYVLLYLISLLYNVFTPTKQVKKKDLPMSLSEQSEFKKIGNFCSIVDW